MFVFHCVGACIHVCVYLSSRLKHPLSLSLSLILSSSPEPPPPLWLLSILHYRVTEKNEANFRRWLFHSSRSHAFTFPPCLFLHVISSSPSISESVLVFPRPHLCLMAPPLLPSFLGDLSLGDVWLSVCLGGLKRGGETGWSLSWRKKTYIFWGKVNWEVDYSEVSLVFSASSLLSLSLFTTSCLNWTFFFNHSSYHSIASLHFFVFFFFPYVSNLVSNSPRLSIRRTTFTCDCCDLDLQVDQC